ncbi:hypothetical protein E7T06_06080 [Deinococcus sp. Arct2-2]|uniref:hypothetical protein n=1 Tax=Deinococcus sp. Arct2-2 TaxID=2568653 RepID=UPI0010A3019B|nr:hypothetical protein [Deinococcus sp. Arct2-2]THF70703.1 hypothetical protein E7T06_06080 [Deinococcus sp. Arct2-2]
MTYTRTLTPRIQAQHRQVQEAHSLGFLNPEIAELLDLSLSTVKRCKNELGLGSNEPRNALAKCGEEVVAEYLTAEGHPVYRQWHTAPDDLRVNGWRLDVKTTGSLHGRCFRFRLDERRTTKRGQKVYQKDFQRDVDFFLLAVVEEGVLTQLYCVPVALHAPILSVCPGDPACAFAPYRWATHLLGLPMRQAV